MQPPPPQNTPHVEFLFVLERSPGVVFVKGGSFQLVARLLFSLRTSLGASDHQNQTYLHLISVRIRILTLADSCFLFFILKA